MKFINFTIYKCEGSRYNFNNYRLYNKNCNMKPALSPSASSLSIRSEALSMPSATAARFWPDQPAFTITNRVFLVLPAFNEAESLPGMFRRVAGTDSLAELDLTICVIDDGSTDDTALIAGAGFPGLKIRLIRHPQNRGLGGAMQTGLTEAANMAGSDDVIIAMDADDTHDVGLIPELIDAIRDGADIAIASRFVPGGDDRTAPPFRRLLSRGASVVFKTIFPVTNVNDFTCGYRAYRAGLLQEARMHFGERLVEERGFACMMELLLKLRHWKPEIKEVPMILRYDRKESASKLKLFRTLRQYLTLALRDRLSPAPHHA